MKIKIIHNLRLLLLVLFTATVVNCIEQTNPESEPRTEKRTNIELVTTKGTIIFELYNETPKHRDNFLKLLKKGTLDSLLFHRVINQFLIQGGDPKSKYAKPDDTLGNGGLDSRIDAEFHPNLFNKRGALVAARDNNPERASSNTQFCIIQRGPRNDSLIDIDQKRINIWLAQHYMQKDTLYKPIFSALDKASKKQDIRMYQKFDDSLKTLIKSYTNYKKYTIPEAHRIVYRTLGGTPHLDQNYTVFGEVLKGMDVVDTIAKVKTNSEHRPIEDIRIVSVKIYDN